MRSQNINLYLTTEHACGYLPDRMATNLVPDPKKQMNMELYSQLIQLGYRRSGGHTYRPHCQHCQECLPCRIPAEFFTPNRSQKRCLKHNEDLTTRIVPACFSAAHFELYRNYVNSRHGDGDMVNPEPEDYKNFLYSEWSNTFLLSLIKTVNYLPLPSPIKLIPAYLRCIVFLIPVNPNAVLAPSVFCNK